MTRSKSSNRWLQEHFKDPYVILAQKENYRGRAIYKLKEIDEKEKIIKPGMNILDLGAAPGSWSQYLIDKTKGHGRIVAIDILPIIPIPKINIICGDFTEETSMNHLLNLFDQEEIDLIISDMAPNFSGNPAVDIPAAINLAEISLEFACKNLKLGGVFLTKIFHGEGFDTFIKLSKNFFQTIKCIKPAASRGRSREVYLLAKNLKIR